MSQLEVFGQPKVAHSAVRAAGGLRRLVDGVLDEIAELYLSDSVPWVIGYSGGKDSTTCVQMVWLALQRVEESRRTKLVHVISTDTLVENPVVAAWTHGSLQMMGAAAERDGLPIVAHRLRPRVADSFWVQLIGKGYASPRAKFRWCTERLKIKPSNEFIKSVIGEHGSSILVLGTRYGESEARARSMARAARGRVRERLSPNQSLPGSLAYTPIEDWSSDDVWAFLLQRPNPWGASNKELMALYRGASPDNECPVVLDLSTPSCGKSRFGCWVCTMVTEDRSMTALITNDEENEWMLPLLKFRELLADQDDRDRRDFRRLSGRVQLHRDRTIPGPYLRHWREHLLRELLVAERDVRRLGPETARAMELITDEELEAIRRIWVMDKGEVEDTLPAIVEQVRGQRYAGADLSWASTMLGSDPQVYDLLRECCGGDEMLYESARRMLLVEHRHVGRRCGVIGDLEKVLETTCYGSAEEAVTALQKRQERQEEVGAQLSLLDGVD